MCGMRWDLNVHRAVSPSTLASMHITYKTVQRVEFRNPEASYSYVPCYIDDHGQNQRRFV